MKSKCILVLIMMFCVSEVRAGVISGVTIHDYSSENPGLGRVADNLVNGSGLFGDLHQTSVGIDMWQTQFGSFVPSDNRFAHISFDLGAQYDLGQVEIWNYGEVTSTLFTGYLASGAKDMRISVATDILAPNYIPVMDISLQIASVRRLAQNVLFEAETFSLGFDDVRLVRFDFFSNHHPANRHIPVVGLSEVRFSGSLSSATPTVPEPSSILIAGMLAACTVRHRTSSRLIGGSKV